MKKMGRGFTITELLIAIVILGVLAAMVIGRLTGHTERATVAEAVGVLSAIRQAEVAYHLDHPAGYTSDLSDGGPLDVTVPAVNTTAFNYSADATTGAATATRYHPSEAHNGETIILNIDGTWDAASTHPFAPTD